MTLLSRTIRRCPYGHRHRDGQYLCRAHWTHELKEIRVAQTRSLRRANRVRVAKGLDPLKPLRTQGWETH